MELPLELMLERAEELARRWAIALVLARPLDGLAEVPLEELAREAPELCARVLRALASDVELDSLIAGLQPGERARAPGEPAASRLAEISGAHDAAAQVEAVEALRGVLWDALVEQLDAPATERMPARHAADACDRLAFVCSRVLAASIGAAALASALLAAGEAPHASAGVASAAELRIAAAQRVFQPVLTRAERPVPAGARAASAPGVRARRPRLLIIDERAPGSVEREEPVREALARREIEIRDERSEHSRAPWIAGIARELEAYQRSGRPFSVLAIELRGFVRVQGSDAARPALADDVERVLTAELRQAARALTSGQSGSLREGARAGSLTREGPGRFWLLAPDTDRGGAADLVRRLERALARPASHGGGTVAVAIGSAVCPDDGTDAGVLADHADLDLHASRSSTELAARARDTTRQRRA